MNYIEEEERGERFTKKRRIQLFLLIVVMGIGLSAIFLFFEKRSKEAENETRKEGIALEGGEEAKKPFILDDVKEEVPKTKVESLSRPVSQESIEKTLAGEEGDRICEYRFIKLPEILEAGNRIDVRLSLADGRDYTVLSKKKVGDFLRKDGEDIIWLSLSDLEILFMESALSDLHLFKNARIYAIIHGKETAKEIRVNYPLNYKSRKLLQKMEEETGLPTEKSFVSDEELNEDRRRLIEIGADYISKWKEAATYWKDE